MAIRRVVDVFDWFASATLANAILALKYSVALVFPLIGIQVFQILLSIVFGYYLDGSCDKKPPPLPIRWNPGYDGRMKRRGGCLLLVHSLNACGFQSVAQALLLNAVSKPNVKKAHVH